MHELEAGAEKNKITLIHDHKLPQFFNNVKCRKSYYPKNFFL